MMRKQQVNYRRALDHLRRGFRARHQRRVDMIMELEAGSADSR